MWPEGVSEVAVPYTAVYVFWDAPAA